MFLSDEQKLSLLLNISNKLQESQGITSYEYELFNLIKSSQNNSYEINNIKKIGEENNSNEEKIENRITKEKIRTNIEKIISYIKDKKDYEFISDFFITESSPSINNDNEVINNNKNINSDFDEINEDFLNYFSKNNLTDINSIIEFNKSLKQNKIPLKDEFAEINLDLINTKKKSSKEDLILNDIKKSQKFNQKKNNEEKISNKESMDQEMEEEINRQIFGYTKKMKESARNFGVQLKKDNKTLSNIENLQERANDKTVKEVSRLKEFNYSIKLGFCKLIMLVMMVFGTFFATLFVIKIFPKLA